MADTFNPKILDASIRDVSSYLSDNQKVDLLLYAMRCLQIEGRSRTVIENAIQSCLQVSTLSPENIAKARILRARARLATGAHLSAQEDLQAALQADPESPEATALLHQRSVTVEKLLAPLPKSKERISIEIWREIALYLPRRDLKALLFVPHPISRIASQLLFWELDLHFGASDDFQHEDAHHGYDNTHSRTECEEDARHAQRSADILTRIITDQSFASAVRTLRIFASKNDTGSAFQTGMLTNALPKLINLRNVHLSATSEGIVRILQTCSARLRGLSLQSPDGPPDLSFLELRHLSHFSFSTTGGNPVSIYNFITQNRNSLQTIALESPTWSLPTNALSIRNLTTVYFTGNFPATSHAFAEILTNGRQLETFYLSCCALECSTASSQFRSVQHTNALPFLRHFAFTVHSIGRRTVDRDLFPAISEFLRGRRQLRSLQLVADDETVQHTTGFDAAVWGVLPSLEGLKALNVSYPVDLTPGLASWLIPRAVKALGLSVDYGSQWARDPIAFLNQLRPGIPSGLLYIAFSDLHIRHPAVIIEQGFPMARVLRIGLNYYTVVRNAPPGAITSSPRASTSTPHLPTTPQNPASSSRGGSGAGGTSSLSHILCAASNYVSGYGTPIAPVPAHAHHVHHHHHHHERATSTPAPTLAHLPPMSLSSSSTELEAWPKRRALYHASEWLEWLGCEDAAILGRDSGCGGLSDGGWAFER